MTGLILGITQLTNESAYLPVITGVPGSGKTWTVMIGASCYVLMGKGRKVVVVARSNATLDNIYATERGIIDKVAAFDKSAADNLRVARLCSTSHGRTLARQGSYDHVDAQVAQFQSRFP